MACSSSRVSNTRGAPKRACRPRVSPYTPPLRPTSSPNTHSDGRAANWSASAALIDWARVSGPAALGRLAPERGEALLGRRDRHRRPGGPGSERGHDGGGVGQRRLLGHLGGQFVDDGGQPVVAGGQVVITEGARDRQQGVAIELGVDLRQPAVARLDVGAGVAEEAHRPQMEQGRAAGLSHMVGGEPGGLAEPCPGRRRRPRSIRCRVDGRRSRPSPVGVGTEMPSPLSSQTNSNGRGRPCHVVYPAVLSAPAVVEWFRLASPKLHTATASAGQRVPAPIRRARPIAKATPTARGR